MSAFSCKITGRTHLASATLLAAAAVAAGWGSSASAQLCSGSPAGPTPFPLKPGFAVVTQHDPFGQNFVLATMDVREASCYGTLGDNWCPPQYTGPNGSWSASNLGQVFGVEVDDATPPNIFVTACSLHGPPTTPLAFGPGGAGGVYEINGVTGAITMLPSIAVGAPSLGDITYDPQTQRLFVSDFDKGLIHSFFRNGTVHVDYDHGLSGEPKVGAPPVADDGSPNSTQYARRVWAVSAHAGRLYYSVWKKDQGQTGGTRDNEIWSVALNGGAGLFNTNDIRRELIIPKLPGLAYSNPVASIEFANDGRMLLAERGRNAAAQDYAPHQARVLEYVPTAGGWAPSGSDFWVGMYGSQTNSAGGAAYDDCTATDFYACLAWTSPQPQAVWASGDALANVPGYGAIDIYGAQRIHQLGNTTATVQSGSYFVDFNGVPGTQDKTTPHDIDVVVACEPVLCSFEIESVDCFFEGAGASGYYTVTVKATNGSNALLATKLKIDNSSFPISLAPGQSITQAYTQQYLGGSGFVNVALYDSYGNLICNDKVFFNLPECTCFELQGADTVLFSTSGAAFDTLNATLNLRNFAAWPVKWVTIVPLTNNVGWVTPASFSFPAAIVPGSTFSVNFSSGLAALWFSPGACFQVILHNADFSQCCSREWCFLPSWDIGDFGDLIGDIDGDGLVASSDLAAFLGMWGSMTPIGDFDGDGEVAGADLGILLANWGKQSGG